MKFKSLFSEKIPPLLVLFFTYGLLANKCVKIDYDFITIKNNRERNLIYTFSLIDKKAEEIPVIKGDTIFPKKTHDFYLRNSGIQCNDKKAVKMVNNGFAVSYLEDYNASSKIFMLKDIPVSNYDGIKISARSDYGIADTIFQKTYKIDDMQGRDFKGVIIQL